MSMCDCVEGVVCDSFLVGSACNCVYNSNLILDSNPTRKASVGVLLLLPYYMINTKYREQVVRMTIMLFRVLLVYLFGSLNFSGMHLFGHILFTWLAII